MQINILRFYFLKKVLQGIIENLKWFSNKAFESSKKF
jgi:hypothetical protein